MVMLEHPLQDPGSTVLDILQFLETFARNPDEDCLAIVQPGGDEGMDKLYCIYQSECGMEFGNISEVK